MLDSISLNVNGRKICVNWIEKGVNLTVDGVPLAFIDCPTDEPTGLVVDCPDESDYIALFRQHPDGSVTWTGLFGEGRRNADGSFMVHPPK